MAPRSNDNQCIFQNSMEFIIPTAEFFEEILDENDTGTFTIEVGNRVYSVRAINGRVFPFTIRLISFSDENVHLIE